MMCVFKPIGYSSVCHSKRQETVQWGAGKLNDGVHLSDKILNTPF